MVGACTAKSTSVTVVFHAETGATAAGTTLQIQVDDGAPGGGYDQTEAFAPDGPATWPARLPVRPTDGDVERPFIVIGTLRDEAGTTVSSVSAEIRFVAHEDREVRLWFDDDCAGEATCGATESCSRGACVDHCVDATPPGETDRSEYRACSQLDAGPDASDGGPDGSDGGPDADADDAGPSDGDTGPSCGPRDPSDDRVDWRASYLAAVDLGLDRSVRSQSELAGALGAAGPGSVIVIEPGVYESWSGLRAVHSGEAGNPIVITSRGCVEGTGEASIIDNSAIGAPSGDVIRFESAHHYVVGCLTFRDIDNHVFRMDGTSGSPVPGSTNIRITENVFERIARLSGQNGGGIILTFRSHDNRIDHNRFSQIYANAVTVRHQLESDPNGAITGTRVDHNEFLDAPTEAELDAEAGITGAIYAGSRAFASCCSAEIPSDTPSATFEHNRVEDIGLGTAVSFRGNAIVRFNTFVRTPKAISLTSVDTSRIEGNLIVGDPDNLTDHGISVRGRDVTLINNVLYDVESGINIDRWGNDGTTCVGPFGVPTRDIVVAHNTILEAGNTGFHLGRSNNRESCPVLNVQIRGNVVATSSGDIGRYQDLDEPGCDPSVCGISEPAPSSGRNDITIDRNFFYTYGTATEGSMVAYDVRRIVDNDPMFTVGCEGVPFRVSPMSPATLEGADDLSPPIAVDIDNLARPGGGGNYFGADQPD